MAKRKRTIADEIKTIAQHEILQLPGNMECEIIKNYPNDTHVDVNMDNTLLKYVQCIGDNTVGNKAIITFLNKDTNQPIVISDNQGFQTDITKLIGDINDFIGE